MAEEISVTLCKNCKHSEEGIGGLVCTKWDAPTDDNGWCYKGKDKKQNVQKRTTS